MKKLKQAVGHLYELAFYSKFSRRISSVFFLFLVMSAILTYFLYRYESKEYAVKNISQYSGQTLISVRSNITEMLDGINSNFNLLQKSGLSEIARLPVPPDKRQAYDNMLFTVIDTYKHLDSVYLLDFDCRLYGVDKFNAKTLSIGRIEEAPWYRQVMEAQGSYVLSYNGGGIFNRNYKDDFMSVIRLVNDLETQKPIAVAIMNIPVASFQGLLDTVFYQQHTPVILYDKYNKKICSSSFFEEIQGEQHILQALSFSRQSCNEVKSASLAAGLYISEFDWKLVAAFPLNSETVLSHSLLRITLLVLAANLLLMLLFSIFISSSIQRPLYHLLSSMHDAESGAFRPVMVQHPKSEIGILETNYNHMIHKIQSLLTKLVEEQHQKRKFELRALQEQIKPHFLYNTLDAIGYMSMTDERQCVYDAIETLGSFYRSSLSSGRQMIPISQELQIVRDYAALLSLRYESLFTILYEIEESFLDREVPRLLLQPLVENAVYHGIKPLGEPGIIQIKVLPQKSGSRILIQVSDNGVGMEEAVRLSLLKPILEEKRDSFGLTGTLERIRIIYHNDITVSIESRQGKGTRISLSIPVQPKGELP